MDFQRETVWREKDSRENLGVLCSGPRGCLPDTRSGWLLSHEAHRTLGKAQEHSCLREKGMRLSSVCVAGGGWGGEEVGREAFPREQHRQMHGDH